MKYFCILLLLCGSVFAQDNQLKDERDKVSYSIGLDIGTTFNKQGMEVNPEVVLRGLKDGIGGAKPLMTDEEMRTTMTEYSKKMMEKQQTALKEQATKNGEAGEKFLAENKTKEGVKATSSGLQFKVLQEGNGPTPKATDTVVVQYRGTHLNGTEFDSSYSRNTPATFPLNRVIPGWTEGLQLMKVGSKYQFVIPASLAYRERGQPGGGIEPNETLVFEVELMEIKPEATPAPTASPAASPAASASTAPKSSAKPSATPEKKASPKGESKAPDKK